MAPPAESVVTTVKDGAEDVDSKAPTLTPTAAQEDGETPTDEMPTGWRLAVIFVSLVVVFFLVLLDMSIVVTVGSLVDSPSRFPALRPGGCRRRGEC